MSQNVSALTLTTEVTATGNKWSGLGRYCVYANGTASTESNGYCRSAIRPTSSTLSSLTQIRTNFTIPVKKDYYYKTYLSYKANAGTVGDAALWRIQTSSDFIIASFEEISDSASWYQIDCKNSGIGTTNVYCTGTGDYWHNVSREQSKFYEVTLKALNDGNYYWSFGDGTNALFYQGIDSTSLAGSLPLVTIYEIEEFKANYTTDQLDRIDANTSETNDILKENQEKEQQAEDNISNQTTDDMGDSENAATSSLIGILSDFVDALKSSSAGTCSLSLPLPSFLGGTIAPNLCDLPSDALRIIQIGSSIAMIMFYIPLAYVIISMIYNEIRSFTNANG